MNIIWNFPRTGFYLDNENPDVHMYPHLWDMISLVIRVLFFCRFLNSRLRWEYINPVWRYIGHQVKFKDSNKPNYTVREEPYPHCRSRSDMIKTGCDLTNQSKVRRKNRKLPPSDLNNLHNCSRLTLYLIFSELVFI